MQRISLAILTVLLTAGPAPLSWAHWEGRNETFPWATPGQVIWVIDYHRIKKPHVKRMLDAKFNLLQGGSFTPEALALAKSAPGVHTMQYICSRTIYHERLFQTNPELKDAAILNPDGTYKIIYHNPARYAGCYNREAWLNYIKGRMDALKAIGLDAVFFDNPMTWACYCPTCKERFRRFSREKTGRQLELGQFGKPTELERWFTIETARQFFEKVHAHARQKGLFIVANNLTYWLVNQDVTDGVFTEAWAHPPFGNDIAAYKIGLAASHGKPTGILSYIPGAAKKARGRMAPNTSRGSGEKPVGAPVAEEYELGYAEGLACGGNYMPNYSLELGRHIPDMTDPEDARIQAAMVKYGTYVTGHPELYAHPQPGSSIAVLYSLTTGPREGQILGIRRSETNKLLWTLIRGGIPAEVIVEDDLTPGRLAGLRAVVVSDVQVLEPEAAAGLAGFVRSGGTVLFAEPGKVRGRYESPDKAKPLSAYFPGVPAMERFVYGPEELAAAGYESNGRCLKVSQGTGRATAAFSGPAGEYRVTVSYLDENDGQGRFELEVNGKRIGEWRNNADDNAWHRYVSPAVQLQPGAKVTVVGRQGGGEYARIRQVKISTDLGAEDIVQAKLGEGKVLLLDIPLTAATDDLRGKALAALRPLCSVRGVSDPWPEKLLLNATRSSSGGALCVHLANYDFTYDDKYALQSIRPAGPVKIFVRGARTARLLSPDGADSVLNVTDGVIEVPPVRIYSTVVVH
ncbi:MAG: hypothetical protein GXP25_03430 [Planctomycetes bacterium]|nr:hypothetical protein [Planctomycetota bacterium]